MTLKKTFDGLTEEQKSKAKACKTAEELRALAEAEGFELTDEQLEAISGGGGLSGCQGVCRDVCLDDGWYATVGYNVGSCGTLGTEW